MSNPEYPFEDFELQPQAIESTFQYLTFDESGVELQLDLALVAAEKVKDTYPGFYAEVHEQQLIAYDGKDDPATRILGALFDNPSALVSLEWFPALAIGLHQIEGEFAALLQMSETDLATYMTETGLTDEAKIESERHKHQTDIARLKLARNELLAILPPNIRSETIATMLGSGDK
jgi:hypothetical protein